MENTTLLRKHRKRLLFDPDSLTYRINLGRDDIKKIIPHREPMLLLDRITAVDLEMRSIVAERWIDPADPVFAGHFPDYPVYPGMLLLEMLGQAGVALCYFLSANDHRISDDAKPVGVRAIKVLGAYFLDPVLPGSHVTLIGSQIVWDSMIGRFFGQVLVDGKIAATSIGEMLIFHDQE